MNFSGTVYHPEFDQEMHYDVTPLSGDPDTQVAQTIERMRRHVIEDARSAPIQRDAAAIQGSGSGDPLSDTFWWVKRRVGFRQDAELSAPVSQLVDGEVVEVLIRPRDLANMRTPLEDCDGFASLLPSLLRAQGVPCSFVTVAADSRDPSRFSHVYVACYPEGRRVSLDSSHGPYPGWECTEAGPVWRIKEWPIDVVEWSQVVLWGLFLFAAAKCLGVL